MVAVTWNRLQVILVLYSKITWVLCLPQANGNEENNSAEDPTVRLSVLPKSDEIKKNGIGIGNERDAR